MDLSALIFVALAVAWAVYLIPKALKHHDEVVRSRSIERFSKSMRILARREPVDARNARLVVTPLRSPAPPRVETKARATAPAAAPSGGAVTPVPRIVTRASAARAARRRRTVLSLILVANAVVVGLASFAVVGWPWVAIPAGLLVAWLVACRVSVRAERSARAARTSSVVPGPTGAIEAGEPADATGSMPPVVAPRVPAPSPAPVVPAGSPVSEAPGILTGEIPIVSSDPGAWDMVPTVLPTYVDKSAAVRRTVSTIDLDSTGVWSSGRNDDDSALARSAEASSATARAAGDEAAEAVGEKRASGA